MGEASNASRCSMSQSNCARSRSASVDSKLCLASVHSGCSTRIRPSVASRNSRSWSAVAEASPGPMWPSWPVVAVRLHHLFEVGAAAPALAPSPSDHGAGWLIGTLGQWPPSRNALGPCRSMPTTQMTANRRALAPIRGRIIELIPAIMNAAPTTRPAELASFGSADASQ